MNDATAVLAINKHNAQYSPVDELIQKIRKIEK